MKDWGKKEVCRKCEDSDSDFEPLPPLKRTKQIKKSIILESDPDNSDEESGYI